MMEEARAMTLAAALVAIKAHIGAVDKGKKMEEGPAKYKYRSIDDILEAAHVGFVHYGVTIAPRVTDKFYEMRSTRNGNPMQWVSLSVEWIVVGPDGSMLTPAPLTVGEATDTSDKATNKAHTAAYKVLLSQLFAIPYSGDEQDADRNEMGHPDPWEAATENERTTADRAQDILDHELDPEAAARVCATVSTTAGTLVTNVRDLPPSWARVWKAAIKQEREASTANAVSVEPDAALPANGSGSGDTSPPASPEPSTPGEAPPAASGVERVRAGSAALPPAADPPTAVKQRAEKLAAAKKKSAPHDPSEPRERGE